MNTPIIETATRTYQHAIGGVPPNVRLSTINESTGRAGFHGPRFWEHAADAWAEAAGAHGAYAPRHIAEIITSKEAHEVDVLEAAREGCRRAQREHDEEACGGPDPRGVDVTIEAGNAVGLVWRSESHTVTLRIYLQWAEVRVESHSVPIEDSARWQALLADRPDHG